MHLCIHHVYPAGGPKQRNTSRCASGLPSSFIWYWRATWVFGWRDEPDRHTLETPRGNATIFSKHGLGRSAGCYRHMLYIPR